MAKRYTNSVPLGRAGTGAAVVLGESQAAGRLLDTIDYNRQIEQKNRLLALQQAQQIGKSYHDNALKVKNGLLFQDPIRELSNKHINQGIEYRKQGWDVYNPDPNDPNQMQAHQEYLMDRARIEDLMGRREKWEEQAKEANKLLSSAPAGTYDRKSIDEYNKFLQGDIRDYVKNGIDMPVLRKAFDVTDVISKVAPSEAIDEYVKGNQEFKTNTISIPKTRQALISQYKATPGGSEYLSDIAGGFDVDTLEALPKTKEAIRKEFISEYDGNPVHREALARKGITSKDDPKFQEAIDRAAKAKEAYEQTIESNLAAILPKATPINSVKPNYAHEDQAMSRRRLQLAEEENSRARTNAAKPTYRQDVINRIISDDESARDEVIDAVKGGIMTAGGTLRKNFQHIKNKDGSETIVVPVVYGDVNEYGEAKILRGQTSFKYNPKNKSESARVINNMMNIYTGEKVPLSAVLTPEGKKKVPGGQSEKNFKDQGKKSINKSDIPDKARAAGYTTSEYEKLLRQKGIIIN